MNGTKEEMLFDDSYEVLHIGARSLTDCLVIDTDYVLYLAVVMPSTGEPTPPDFLEFEFSTPGYAFAVVDSNPVSVHLFEIYTIQLQPLLPLKEAASFDVTNSDGDLFSVQESTYSLSSTPLDALYPPALDITVTGQELLGQGAFSLDVTGGGLYAGEEVIVDVELRADEPSELSELTCEGTSGEDQDSTDGESVTVVPNEMFKCFVRAANQYKTVGNAVDFIIETSDLFAIDSDDEDEDLELVDQEEAGLPVRHTLAFSYTAPSLPNPSQPSTFQVNVRLANPVGKGLEYIVGSPFTVQVGGCVEYTGGVIFDTTAAEADRPEFEQQFSGVAKCKFVFGNNYKYAKLVQYPIPGLAQRGFYHQCCYHTGSPIQEFIWLSI